MPSWNIHLAHAGRLLHEVGASRLGVRDEDAFLIGNLVPDIYAGHMVAGLSRKVDYKVTHFADPVYVPEPRFWEFWERHAVPSAHGGRVSDVCLGAWAHLMADHAYNHCTNAFIRSHGITPGEEARIGKQGDFDLFGRSLELGRVGEPTPSALAQCAAFPQYELEESAVRAACAVMEGIARENREHPAPSPAPYRMLDAAFFSQAFEAAHGLMASALMRYASEGAEACCGMREPFGPPIEPGAAPLPERASKQEM